MTGDVAGAGEGVWWHSQRKRLSECIMHVIDNQIEKPIWSHELNAPKGKQTIKQKTERIKQQQQNI